MGNSVTSTIAEFLVWKMIAV